MGETKFWRAFGSGAVACLVAGSAVTTTGAAVAGEPNRARFRSGDEARLMAQRHKMDEMTVEKAESRSSEGLVPESRSSGTVALDLQGRFQEVHYSGEGQQAPPSEEK